MHRFKVNCTTFNCAFKVEMTFSWERSPCGILPQDELWPPTPRWCLSFGRIPKNTLMVWCRTRLTRSHSISVGFTLQDSHLCVVTVPVGSHLIKLNTSLSLGHRGILNEDDFPEFSKMTIGVFLSNEKLLTFHLKYCSGCNCACLPART